MDRIASEVDSSLWKHWAGLLWFNVCQVQFFLVLRKIAFDHLTGDAVPRMQIQFPHEDIPLFIGGDDPRSIRAESQGIVLLAASVKAGKRWANRNATGAVHELNLIVGSLRRQPGAVRAVAQIIDRTSGGRCMRLRRIENFTCF